MSRFDELFAEAAPLIATQEHQRDEVPAEGGRWPISVVLVPNDDVAARLDALARAALRLAGPGHFATGCRGSAHLTVRSLERYRGNVRHDDAAVVRYRAALQRVAARCDPVTLRLAGLTLTPLTVMACAEPVDDSAGVLAAALADELGEDGWHEANFTRDIWYASLVHFTGDVLDPSGLLQWVSTHRAAEIGIMRCDLVDLVHFRHLAGGDLRQMAPHRLARCRLGVGELVHV